MTRPPPDSELFVSLVETHRRPLLKVCWAYGRSSHDRDDLFQDIVARLWASFPSYDRGRPFSTWMFRVALNVAIDWRRRHVRRGREATSLTDDGIADPAATTDDEARSLRELLDRQTEDDRALLLLYLDGHSHREIGDVLGTSESNVGTRLNRLKTSMRKTVETQGR